MRIGVEVGGTFTDLVAITEAGVEVVKVPSTPRNPDEGAFNALIESGVTIAEIDDLAHGSTVATNAVLERKGFSIAFVTTAGFRDILAMQRHNRTNIYDLEYRKPAPVVARKDSFEVCERISADGAVIEPLNEKAVADELIPALEKGGYVAVAICLLNAYANPQHELRLAALLRERLPEIFIAPSHEITREFREYERASTTTLSAYVQPVVDRYLGRFEKRLAASGFAGRFSVMQSNGGRLPAEGMRKSAITALLSGPAAGVMGATRQAGRSDFHDLITLDMGGTSTDVCLVAGGVPQLTTEFQIDGLPIRSPVLDINTVGAGGGSIVWIDEGGMLRAGPASAGADPGPACYGRGGTEPTITDAHVIRGTIRPEAFLGGRMAIDVEAARHAFQPIAEALGMSVEDAADSAIRVANANIVRAIQLISTERGKDPRDYVLVPFGGAGPLHAAQVAEDLGIRTIIIPPNAGVISAYGLLASDYVIFDSMTRRALLDAAAPGIVADVYEEMSARATARFAEMGFAAAALQFDFIADMRFVGQAFEVPVELAGEAIPTLTAEDLRTRFAEVHHRIYLHGAAVDKPVEMVNFRLKVTAPLAELPLLSEAKGAQQEAGEVEIFDNREGQAARSVSRASVAAGKAIEGPALLGDPTSTIFVPRGWSASTDSAENLIIRRI